MAVSDFLSRHAGHDFASPSKIIQISFQIKVWLNNSDKLHSIIEALKDIDRLNAMSDIICQAKKAPSPVKRVTRRTAQPGEEALIWPLTDETRRPEQIHQSVQRQIQPNRHVVQEEVHVPMEPPEAELPVEPQIPDESLKWVREPLTLKYQIPRKPVVPEPTEQKGKLWVPEPQQLPMLPPQHIKPMFPEQLLPLVLPRPRSMPLQDPVPIGPDDQVPFHGSVNPGLLEIRLLVTLPGHDNYIDNMKLAKVTIGQLDKTMYKKSRKLFDEMQGEMIFRKHLCRQLENKQISRIPKKEGDTWL